MYKQLVEIDNQIDVCIMIASRSAILQLSYMLKRYSENSTLELADGAILELNFPKDFNKIRIDKEKKKVNGKSQGKGLTLEEQLERAILDENFELAAELTEQLKNKNK
jgi:hypothetical protein